MTKKVFFGIPSYKGIRCVEFYESLEQTITLCRENGWETSLSILQGCCYVQVARNELVKNFLDSDSDILFFLDDDISWNPKDALKLLNMDENIIAGIYPHKTDEENYPVVIHTEEDGRPKVKENGNLEGAFIPFGFVCIKRHVIQKMWDTYKSLRYFKPVDNELIEYIDLFPQGVKNGRWVGEDFAFCQLWHELHGEIDIVPDIDFVHYTDVGSFPGNYHKYLLKQPGGSDFVKPDLPEFAGITIPGWMSLKEQKFLYEKSSKYESVLEIGSMLGRSAAVLLSGNAKKVYCVDFWKTYKHIPKDTEEKAEERYKQFQKNIEPYKGNNGKLSILRMDSLEAAKVFDDKTLDMVFIDGDHTYEGVMSDIRAWLPKTKKLICGHDYTYSWPGVKKAVDECFGNKIKREDTIWYVEL